MFKCNKCNIEKDTTEFYKNASKMGHAPRCKDCAKQADKDRKRERAESLVHPETYEQMSERKLQEFKERNQLQKKLKEEKDNKRISKKRKLNMKKYKETPIEKLILSRAKSRAKRLKILFDLKVEDIIVPDKCPILGIPIYRSDEGRVNSPSLDRIIPEYGYTKHNVQVISNRANTLKSNATPEELLLFAKWSVKYFGKRCGGRAVTDQK